MEDLYAQLSNGKIFSKLDTRNGYYQIAIAEEDVHKSAFVTPYGHFEVLRIRFGLTTAPRTFQWAISRLFEKQNNVLVFLDNLLVFTDTVENHFSSLRKTFEILETNHVLLNIDKCVFWNSEIRYLGNIIKPGSIEPDLSTIGKLKAGGFRRTFDSCENLLRK